jgi:hypothetical protein
MLGALTMAAGLFAQDLPYAGKWKLNPAQSDIAGPTVTYVKLAAGDWQASADGMSYKFKLDGKEYPDGLGDTATWKGVDASTWQTTWKMNGKVLATDTLRLGADGILTVNSKGTKPNGEPIDDTTTYQRVSGGPGLAGKWKTKGMQSASPLVIALDASPGNGLSFKEPAMSLTCDGKLDGKDYPCSGATISSGWAVAMTKTGARSLSILVKKDGKPFYKFDYLVAADNKTMTETGGAVATGEKMKMVFERQ